MKSWPDEMAAVAGPSLYADERNGFVLTVRKGEKFFLNGAVVEAVNRLQIRLLNDANFLLGSHILQQEEATTPLRQLYFVAQAILMNPSESKKIANLYNMMASNFQGVIYAPPLIQSVDTATEYIKNDKPFLAMRTLRRAFPLEDSILSACDRSSSV